MIEWGDNKLKANSGQRMIFSLLWQVQVQGKKVLLWRVVDNTKLFVDLKVERIKKFSNQLVYVGKPDQKEQLLKVLKGEEKLNFFIPSDSILFQAPLREFEEESLKLTMEMPEVISQIERRKYFRLKVPDSLSVRVRFQKKVAMYGMIKNLTFQKNCLDVSAGGLSFLMTRDEAKYIEKGDVIKDIILNLGSALVKVSMEIVNKIVLEPNETNNIIYRGWKFSCKFLNMEKSNQELIEIFVFNHMNINSDD